MLEEITQEQVTLLTNQWLDDYGADVHDLFREFAEQGVEDMRVDLKQLRTLYRLPSDARANP